MSQKASEEHQTILHVPARWLNQLNVLLEEKVNQRLQDVTFIARQTTLQLLGQRLTVIHIAWSQIEGDRLALIIDDKIQFEAIEPVQRALGPAEVVIPAMTAL